MAKKEIKHPGVEISELYTNNIKTNISIYVEEGGKRIGDKMCYPTAVAVALSRLGIENPRDDMQYEDYIQTLFDTDTNLSGKYAGNIPPRGNPYAEADMVKKYFGVNSDIKLISADDYANTSQISNFYNTTIKSNINNGKQVILSTGLTKSGHIVNLNRVTERGIYFQDSYGIPTFETNGVTYQKNSINWRYTAGTNVFASWEDIKEYNIGIGKYYMTIGR